MNTRKIVLTLLLGLGIPALSVTRMSSAQAAPRQIDIVAKRFEYEPSEITLKKGEPVVITFKSVDATHGIHFEDLGLETRMEKGSTGQLTFTPDKTGDFVGHCSVFCGAGHGGMMLTMHVTD
jgi:cytochrome c oxidase subunit II